MSADAAIKPEEAAAASETPGPKQKVSGVSGEVVRAQRFGLWVSFVHEGQTHTGALFPGRSYANGSKLLLDVCRSDQELALLFPKGMAVKIDAVLQPGGFRQGPDDIGGGGPAGGRADRQKKNPQSKKQFLKCGWMITLLWVGNRPTELDFLSVEPLVEHDKHFQARLDWIDKHVLSAPDETPKPVSDVESWFVKALLMPSSKTGLPHPDEATFQGKEGVVVELQRPDGGIIEVEGQKVFFHRSRVFVDDMHLSVTLDLSQFVAVGSTVKVDYVENESYFDDCPAEFVALLVYTGERPRVPTNVFDNMTKKGEKYFIAKILSFDAPGETGVESGIAEILRPSGQTSLKNSFKKFIDVNPEVKKVRFHRNNMFHLGTLLHKADLQYFFSAGAQDISIFYCYIKPIEGVAKNADVKHEVSLGWKGSVSFSNSATSNNPDDTLLYPRIFSFQSAKFCAKEGFDAETFENIIEGLLPPRCSYFSGNENVSSDFVIARVHDLFPPSFGKNLASAGIVRVESGVHDQELVYFDRSVTSAFGFKLDKANLQHMLEQNEPVFVKVESVAKKELHVKLKAVEMWLGWPHKEGQTLDKIPSSDRHKLLLYLNSKNMSLSDFLKALEGKSPPRAFIPFKKDENKGTVIQLDHFQPFSKNKGGKAGSNQGAVAGIIKVDKGPLAGQLVSFHRKNAWVLGYNLSKADLTHIFIEGQKVSLEGIKMPVKEDKNKKGNSTDLKTSYKATLVWTSKFRPRSDITKTVPESNHVNNWLKKRNLDWNKFQLLVQGKLPIVDSALFSRNKSNMLKGTDGKEPSEKTSKVAEVASPAKSAEKVPVFRHGSEAGRICDTALSVTGPNDTRIKGIIKNDANAQMAFHIHKTLGLALEVYKKSRQSPWLNERAVFSGSSANGDNSVWARSETSSAIPHAFAVPSPYDGFANSSAAFSSPYSRNSTGFFQNSSSFVQDAVQFQNSSMFAQNNSAPYAQNSFLSPWEGSGVVSRAAAPVLSKSPSVKERLNARPMKRKANHEPNKFNNASQKRFKKKKGNF